MSVAHTIAAFAAALSAPAQLQRVVDHHDVDAVLVALVAKRSKLLLAKEHLECFGLCIPYRILYRGTLAALRGILLKQDERGLFTSVNTTAVKMANFTHDALFEKELDRVGMALAVCRDSARVANVHVDPAFLKLVYVRYCAATFRRTLTPAQ